MNTVAKKLELPGAFILGAAAGPYGVLGMNAEVNQPSSCNDALAVQVFSLDSIVPILIYFSPPIFLILLVDNQQDRFSHFS